MTQKHQYLKFGRLLLKQHALEVKARALKEDLRKVIPGDFYHCIGYGDNGLVVDIKLVEYLALNPDAEPCGTFLHEKSEYNPETYARLEYPNFHVGELAPGQHLWVKATSGKFTPPTLANSPVIH